ncbi:carboxylesterase family protein (plasmid) [Bradyrhizobium elkanii USDA 94]|nr:carboxylesterase family protein [Bradyrhizobium elkanii]WLC12836.1 carboxylesterase family protein [Bradyrhizobium elkanii USDA 94]
MRTRRSAEAAAKKIMDVGSLKTMAHIKAAPVRDLLLQAQATGEPDGVFAPISDGSLVALDPAEAFASGTSRHVEIMIGANANEMNYWAMYDSKFRNPYVEDTDLGAKIDVFSMLPSIRDTSEEEREKAKVKLRRTYEKVLGLTDQRTIEAALVDDVVMTQPATHLAERQSASGGKVWLYRFTWHVPPKYLDPALPALGAFHAIELPFMFGTADFSQIPGGPALSKAPGPEILRLTNQMLTAWTNFAKKGDPNGDGVPKWPSYDTNTHILMVWSADSKAVADPDRSRREIWENWHFNPY